jgi:hypothetical protein
MGALSARLETLFRKQLGETEGTEMHSVLGTEVATLSGGDVMSVDPQTTVGVGAKNGSAITAVENGNGAVHKTVLTLTALSVTMTDATTSGCHGAHKLYDFPAGPIQILGSSMNLTTLAGSGGIANGAALVGSIGSATVGTNNATLTTTEADLIASKAGTLTAGAGTLASHGGHVATAFDGTATAVDAFLNLAVPDADSSASDTVTVSGTVTLHWINLGDY